MPLVAEEDRLVLGERGLDCRDRGVGQVAGEPDIADLCADAAGERMNLEVIGL
jgi:hypothetical protein